LGYDESLQPPLELLNEELIGLKGSSQTFFFFFFSVVILLLFFFSSAFVSSIEFTLCFASRAIQLAARSRPDCLIAVGPQLWFCFSGRL
jgi:hypothetical protein